MATHRAPPEVARLAEECVREVNQELGFSLDHTVETLPVLDHYCRQARRGQRWPEGARHIAATVGAYFGEVLRARYKNSCRWHLSADGFHAWRLEFENFFLCFNPVGAALELLLEGSAQGWNADFVTLPEASDDLESHLDSLPGVSEEDYYTLSVRYEVLETIQHFLERWQTRQEGFNPSRRYTAKDYEERLAQLQPDLSVELE